MYRQSKESDFEAIYGIINAAAVIYKGVIPADRWKEPYMPNEELTKEIDVGVIFWCWGSMMIIPFVPLKVLNVR